MHLCEDKHDEVCFVDVTCPACHSIGVVQDDLDEMTKERDELKKECEQWDTEATERDERTRW